MTTIRRRKRIPLSVTLFPFLAVLICTLGVLIVLLVLAVRAADLEAAEDVANIETIATEQAERINQLTAELDERSLAIDILGDARQSIVDRATAAREHRGHLESEIRQLRDSMAQLEQEWQQLQHISANTSPDTIEMQRLAAQVAQLKIDISSNESELAEKQEMVEEVPQPMYSIVPHAGSGGTFRRPIFIESTERGLTLQPLGIHLNKADFAMPLGPGNPLDTALLAIREYWLKYDQSQSEGSPYPLVVIRPGGAEGFAIARRAMSSWEDEFGYELVEQEKQLDFGALDAELKKVVQRAIEEALARQSHFISHRPAGSIAGNPNDPNDRNGDMRANAGRGGASSTPSRLAGGSSLSQRRPGLTVSNNAGGFVGNQAWSEATRAAGNGQSSNFSLASSSAGAFESNNLSSSHLQAGSSSASSSGQPFSQSRGASYSNAATDSDQASGLTSQSPPGQAGSNGNPDLAVHLNDAQGMAESGLNSSSTGYGSAEMQSSSRHQSQSSAKSAASPTTNLADATSVNSASQLSSLAASRGSNWALPTAKTNTATAYVRPIRLIVKSDRMVIRSGTGLDNQIPFTQNLVESVDPLINEIWQRIESWGAPGANSFWKPELRVTVEPDGQHHFQALQALLRDSGIDINAEKQE